MLSNLSWLRVGFIAFLFTFSHHLSLAQTLTGQSADSAVSGADLVRYSDGLQRPQFISFPVKSRPTQRSLIQSLVGNGTANASLQTLVPLKTESDGIGHSHATLNQRHIGYRVVGGVYRVHSDNGLVTAASGKLYDDFLAQPTQIISPVEALQRAMTELPANQYAWDVTMPNGASSYVDEPTPELVWIPADLDFTKSFQLAYQVIIHAVNPTFRERLFLDAGTGRLIARENMLHETDTPGIAITRLSGEREIITNRVSDSEYRLEEQARNIQTYDAFGQHDPGLAGQFTDADNYWDNANANQDEIATDAHLGAGVYHDLLAEQGRNSIDDAGHPLTSYVHTGTDYANAYWDGTSSFFGDGSSSSIIDRPLVSIEVVGHEFTHGLIEKTANLIYNSESGALNESFADIFGYMTRYRGRGAGDTSWTIGVEITSGGTGIRSFINPSRFQMPDTYDGDFWDDFADVHSNSSVQNHWFHLLAVGGSGINDLGNAYDIQAVGVDTAFQIAYRVLTVYLTPTSSYADAAFYSQIAAADLFGSCSDVYVSVANAWYAVGLGEPISPESDAAFSANRFACEAPATISFLNLSGLVMEAVWDFGDGTTSTEIDPTHIYNSLGSYTVGLTVTGCDGEVSSISMPDYVVVDPASARCDTTEMVVDGNITVTGCSGVITDSGGADGAYRDGESSSITIDAAGGIITLNFPQFSLESFHDNLLIYDGSLNGGTLIGSYSGTSLQGQTITSSGSSITLLLRTDGSVIDAGFICEYTVDGGEIPASAGIMASGTSLLFNELIEVEPAQNLTGRVTYYDFGDGTFVYNTAQAKHRYTESGSFVITQYVVKCGSADTAYTNVTVSEPGQFAITPDSIAVTLNEGDSATQIVSLSNVSGGPLYYEMALPDPSGRQNSLVYYTDNGAATEHRFSVRPDQRDLQIEVTVNGDFGLSFQNAAIVVDGELISFLSDTPASSATGEDIIKTIVATADQVAQWASDGVIIVNIYNDSSVGINSFLEGDYHKVDISSTSTPVVTTNAPLRGEIAAGASVDVPVLIRSEGLLGGLYQYSIDIITGDSEQLEVALPITLTVIGQPELTISPSSIDFGEVFVFDINDAWVRFENTGTDSVIVTDYELTDTTAYSIVSFSPVSLAPGARDSLAVRFTPQVRVVWPPN